MTYFALICALPCPFNCILLVFLFLIIQTILCDLCSPSSRLTLPSKLYFLLFSTVCLIIQTILCLANTCTYIICTAQGALRAPRGAVLPSPARRAHEVRRLRRAQLLGRVGALPLGGRAAGWVPPFWGCQPYDEPAQQGHCSPVAPKRRARGFGHGNAGFFVFFLAPTWWLLH